MHRISTFLLFVLLTAHSVFSLNAGNGERQSYVSGEVLVQVLPTKELSVILKEVNRLYPDWDLRLLNDIVEPEGIYLLSFDSDEASHDHILSTLGKWKGILLAQSNHYLEERLTPNDGDFPFQWQYVNSGQSGGVSNADLDAELAWEFSTGGSTVEGEEIVLCVIDDGCLSTHPDLMNSLWVNQHEIPNNGIDDDGNGYIDDYRGWNTDDDNDDIDGSLPDHGTAVCGIVGAEGNNSQGVCGVNWDSHLMLVVGGGIESQALAAYSYPLAMRRLYRESSGEKGAFVVVTNASWGVSGADPAESPLWCNMYDRLGAEGIINVAATTNGNSNVDVVGDMPTACGSDYLITVTNLNASDQKVTSAGYGLETIDLGAYGEGVFTTNISGGYGAFGGTSAAAPHVTGAVGLLYASDCPGFLQMAKSDPAAAALMAKDAILQGSSANQSLQDITVTGGRLNLNGSLLWLLDNCPTACNLPPFVQVEEQDTNALRFSWESVDEASTSSQEIRFSGSVMGEEIDSVFLLASSESSWDVSGLLTCGEYVFQIRTECVGEYTDWSDSLIVFTDGCCVPPANLQANQIGDFAFDLSWDAVTAAESYTLSIEAQDGGVEMLEVQGNQMELTLDDVCEQFSIRVSSNCAIAIEDEFAEIFITTSCANCSALPYCEQEAESAQFDQIVSVQLGDNIHLNESADGVAFIPYQGFQWEAGATQNLSIVPEILIANSEEYFRAWIDLNQDGTFSEQEMILNSGPQTEVYSAEIALPHEALEGFSRMRVIMQYDSEPEICSNPNFGQVLDYCIEILPSISSSAEELEEQSALLFPNPVTDVVHVSSDYEMQSIAIFSQDGALVKQEFPGSKEQQLLVDELPAGIFFVEIKSLKSKAKFVSFLKLP